MKNKEIVGFSKISGEIKQFPEDFIVEEITPDKKVCTLGYGFIERLKDRFVGEKKEQLHLTLVKKNWTTMRAVSELAHRLRLGKTRVGYAGTKDKRAVTSQRISIWNVKVEEVKKLKIKDIILKNFEYSDKRLSLGDLNGNKFTIVIRNIQEKNIGKILAKFSQTVKDGIPNYFGPQRFGEQRQVNKEIGKQLLLGNFEGAAMILITAQGKEDEQAQKARKFASDNWGNWGEILKIWPKYLGVEAAVLNYLVKYPTDYANAIRKLQKNLRRMFIHAFQSYIFNKVVEELSASGNCPGEIPLVGYETKLEGEVELLIEKILKQEDVTQEMFRLKRMPELSEPGLMRDSKIFPKKFKILAVGKDWAKISFILDKGSYATVLLGELIEDKS